MSHRHTQVYLQGVQAEGRKGQMLPGTFPARGMQTDLVPSNPLARLGRYSVDAGSPIVAET